MTQKKTYFLILILLATTFLWVGCSKKQSNSIPTKRNALVIRLFSSMERGQYLAAADQAEKISALDPGNSYLTTIVETQNGNHHISLAQKSLKKDDLVGAIKILEAAKKDFPLNRNIANSLDNLKSLQELESHVKNYINSENLDERQINLTRLKNLSDTLNIPDFDSLIEKQQKQLNYDIKKELERLESETNAKDKSKSNGKTNSDSTKK